MGEEPKDLNAQMHAESRREISEIKHRAEERLKEFLTLTSDVHQVSKDLKHLDERLNEGVSKTAFKTFEKVNEISVMMTNMNHEKEKLELKVDSHDEHIKWIYRGVILVIVASVFLKYFIN